jgi:hypothetical protein
MVMREAAWGYQHDVGKTQVADRKQGFYERDASITSSNYYDSTVLNYLRLTQKSLSREA